MHPVMLERAVGGIFKGALARRLAVSGMWSALEALGSRGLLLLAMMMAARLLGAEEFGVLIAVQGTVTLASAVVAEALKFTVATQIAGSVNRDPQTRSRIITLAVWATSSGAVLLSTGLYAGAPFVAAKVFASADLADGLRVGSAVLLCEALSSLQQGILTGLQSFRSLAIAGLARGVVLLPLVAAGAAAGSVTGVLWAIVAAALVGLVIRGIFIRRLMRESRLSAAVRPSGAELALLWQITLPGLLMTLIWVPANWAAMVLLVNRPDGYFETGVLGVANQWLAALLFLPNVLTTVTLPLFSENLAAKSEESFRATVRLSVRTNLVASALPALLVGALSPLIMSFYGPDFADRWLTLVLVCLTAMVSSALNLATNTLAAAGRMFDALLSQLAWAGTFLACTWLMLSASLGANALAGAMLAGTVAKLLVTTNRTGALFDARPRNNG